ncbi:hypothetical protein LQV63_06555 [Paenibacillus profundus]|uniref:Uncharacterized protein n=1 Tax=Paenibacillus profundus TaxID=1173085 RepID=A0ABS8YET4_9BACL|nr:hypothetical protein [Paenibacillus profundus]MCE5168968.1 hypothetical protein [Paenibacillus profundus]
MDAQVSTAIHRELRSMNGRLSDLKPVITILKDAMRDQTEQLKRQAKLASSLLASNMSRQASSASLASANSSNIAQAQASVKVVVGQSSGAVPAGAKDKPAKWNDPFMKSAPVTLTQDMNDMFKPFKDFADNVKWVKDKFKGGGGGCKCCCCAGTTGSGNMGGMFDSGKDDKGKRSGKGSGKKGSSASREGSDQKETPRRTDTYRRRGWRGGNKSPSSMRPVAEASSGTGKGAISAPATSANAGEMGKAAHAEGSPIGKTRKQTHGKTKRPPQIGNGRFGRRIGLGLLGAGLSLFGGFGGKQNDEPSEAPAVRSLPGAGGALGAAATGTAMGSAGSGSEAPAPSTVLADAATTAQTTMDMAHTAQSVRTAMNPMPNPVQQAAASAQTMAKTTATVQKAASAAKKTSWFGKLIKGAKVASKATKLLRLNPAGFLGGLVLDAGLWAAEKYLLPKDEEDEEASEQIPSTNRIIPKMKPPAAALRAQSGAPMSSLSAPVSPRPYSDMTGTGNGITAAPPLNIPGPLPGGGGSMDVSANSNVVMNLNVNGYIDMRMIEEIKRIARDQFDASFRSFERSISSKMPQPQTTKEGAMSY